MSAAVSQHLAAADLLVMAAAVADYTPAQATEGKIEKSDQPLSLNLVRTPDILAEAGRARGAASRPVLIGFAAEAGDPVARARVKLLAKRVDMIVANDITRADAGFDAETNAVTLVTADDEQEVALAPKPQIAAAILDRAEKILSWTPAR